MHLLTHSCRELNRAQSKSREQMAPPLILPQLQRSSRLLLQPEDLVPQPVPLQGRLSQRQLSPTCLLCQWLYGWRRRRRRLSVCLTRKQKRPARRKRRKTRRNDGKGRPLAERRRSERLRKLRSVKKLSRSRRYVVLAHYEWRI